MKKHSKTAVEKDRSFCIITKSVDIYKQNEMKGGWFIGDFEPTVFRNQNFEVGVKTHKKNEPWPTHFHKKAIEITYILKGKMKIQDKILTDGDIFVIKPYEIADPLFLEETTVLVVKSPSAINDKYCVKLCT